MGKSVPRKGGPSHPVSRKSNGKLITGDYGAQPQYISPKMAGAPVKNLMKPAKTTDMAEITQNKTKDLPTPKSYTQEQGKFNILPDEGSREPFEQTALQIVESIPNSHGDRTLPIQTPAELADVE